jgi:glycosyltransferase 2 family protein
VSVQQVETGPAVAEDQRPRANWKSWAGAALGLLVLALAAWGLKKISGQVTLADVMAEIEATPTHLIAFAAVSTFLSYVVLVGYDWFATRHLGYTKIGWPTLAAASFSSFTMSHTLGVTILTGGTVRYRIYTRAGVKPADIAMIILLCGWTFWLGIIFRRWHRADRLAGSGRTHPRMGATRPGRMDWRAAAGRCAGLHVACHRVAAQFQAVALSLHHP